MAKTGRPTVIPQGNELVNILFRHPNLSYQKIHALYNWKGSWRSIANAAYKAGYSRRNPRKRFGGGPMDVMPHEQFWAQVDQHMAEREAVLRAKAERGNSGGLVTLRRTSLRRKYIAAAD